MRNTTARTRRIPANAETREFPAAGVVAYCYDFSSGPAVLAYEGRKLKATLNGWFPTVEKRDEALAAFVTTRTALRASRQTSRSVAHGLVIGDVVMRSWGYDQTNVDFYQVVRVPSPLSVALRRLKSREVSGNPQALTAKVMPKLNEFETSAQAVIVRACGTGQVGSFKGKTGFLSKWNGLPQNVSFYG